MKLSYRDKIILTVAVVIITLVLGVVLIITPAVKTYQGNKATLETKVQECTEIDNKLAAAQNIDQKIKDAYDKGVEISEFFFPEIDAYQIDQFLLPYFASNKFDITDLKIAEPEAYPIPYYTYPLSKVDYPLLHASDLNNELNYNELSGPEGECEPVKMTSLDIEFKTKNPDGLYKFIDEMDELPKSIVVSGLEYTLPDKQHAANGTIEGRMVVQIYSVRKISKPNLD